MEALEQRVKLCTDEKRQLEKKVGQLEKQNSTLMGQLKKLQRIVSESTRHTAKTGTCAMVSAHLLMSYLDIGVGDWDESFVIRVTLSDGW